METTEMDTPARRRPLRRTGLPSSELAGRLGRLAAQRRARDGVLITESGQVPGLPAP